MISTIRKGAYLTDEEHPIGALLQGLAGRRQAKWSISPQPIPECTSQANDWATPLPELQVLSRGHAGNSEITEDEIFQQAVALVNNKIEIDRKVLGGAPCIAGTRIPVYAILELVEAGYSHKKIIRSYPSLSQEDLDAALRFSVIVMTR